MFKFGSRTLVVTMLAALLSLGLVLAGCGGGSGGSGGGLGGLGGGKAALTGATIAITDASGADVGTGTITNGVISLTITGSLTSSSYPLKLVASGGQFVLGGGNVNFDGSLRAYVLETTTQVNITAFTTLHAWMFDRVPGTDAATRYASATNYMNNFFQIMGVSTGATLDFLNDNPYSGANSNAYETAQQLLAYMCGYSSEATGLDAIDSRLKTFADEYMDGVLLAGQDPAGNVAAQMGTNLGIGGITTAANISTQLNTNAVKTQVAQNVEQVFAASTGIAGTGTPPTQAEIEASVTVPPTFATTPMAISGNALAAVSAGAANTYVNTTAITIEDAAGAAMGAETFTITWPSSYTVDADFVTSDGAATTIANGGTLASGGTVYVNLPDTAGTYTVTVACTNNSDVKFDITVETLGADSIAVTGVTLENSASATSTAGITFSTVASVTRPGLIGATATNVSPADISTKLRAVVATTANGSPSAQYFVNFIAPDGVRFVRGAGNYPNYMVTTSAITATGTTNVAMPATQILANQNVTVGLKDFSVNVICMSGGNVLASDSLDNGMYLINDAHEDLIAKVQGFNYGGNTAISSADQVLSGTFNGVYRTWGSLAGTSGAVNTDPSGFYGAPKLTLIPGSAVAGTSGLSADTKTTYGNSITTAFTITGKASGVSAGETGSAAWSIKPTTGAGKTNDAKMWLVIPALNSADADIVSDNPVTVTAP